MRATQSCKHNLLFTIALAANVFLYCPADAGEIRQTATDEETKTRQIYALIQEKGYKCLECHDVDRKVVGPAWRQVAMNRRDHKWASQLLSFKVSRGSVGEYGTKQMPHNEVSEEDTQEIVEWILSLSPGRTGAAGVEQSAGDEENRLNLAAGPTTSADVARLTANEETKTRQIYALIQEKGYKCLECHDVDRKVVGPAWRQVAMNRRDHRWASELLSFKVSRGSVGEYGTEQMPHNEVSEEDTQEIVEWILSLQP